MTDHLRVSDAERREASALLSRHYVDGRLDDHELDERVGAAMRAKTRGDLSRLLIDLPPLAVAPVAASLPQPRRGARRLAALAVALSLLAPASLLARAHASHAVLFGHPPAAVLHLLRLRAERLRLPVPNGRGPVAIVVVPPHRAAATAVAGPGGRRRAKPPGRAPSGGACGRPMRPFSRTWAAAGGVPRATRRARRTSGSPPG